MAEPSVGQFPKSHEGVSGGPDDTLTLREMSGLFIQDRDPNGLYDRILDAIIGLISADMASIHVFNPWRGALQLRAWKGFHPESAAFWEWIRFDSITTCGLAFSSGCRIVVPDTETCAFLAGTLDLDQYRRSKIRAVQSTPLLSRSGYLLGVISTHWRESHQPTEHTLQRLDVLARQVVDLIEPGKIDLALLESEDQSLRQAPVVESSDDAIVSKTLDGIITSWNKGAERIFGYTAEEAVGKPITILFPSDQYDEERAILERIRRGERVHYETVRQRKDGSLIEISLTVSPVKNVEGKIVAASKIARDIY
jgi:PAS domain S-box-containing protein